MPNNCKRGGTFKNIRNYDRYLTEDQAQFVYKKVNAGKEISTETMKQELEQEKSTKTEIDDSCDKTYQKAILNEVNKKEKVSTQMDNWSILSDHVKYVRHDDGLETFHKLNVNMLNYCQYKDLYQELKGKEIPTVDVDFGCSPEKLKSEYLDVYEGVYVGIVSTNWFDENSDLSTTYLGQVNMTRDTEVRAEERFPITTRCYTRGELLDGTDCEILIDTGASKSYMSKLYFMRCKSLHALPKFTSNTQRIQVSNGQYVGILLVMPSILTLQEHRFEVFTLVSEIHENVDLILGIKNMFELEGVVESWDSCLSFLNRSIPFFPREKVEVKPKEQKLIVVEAPFVEEISGMVITKLLDVKEQITLMIKLKFISNRATLKVTNSTQEKVTFDPTDMVGVVDLRSLGYYKVKQGVLQQNLSMLYHFE